MHTTHLKSWIIDYTFFLTAAAVIGYLWTQ